MIITGEVEAQDATFKQNALENLDPEGNREIKRQTEQRWILVAGGRFHLPTLFNIERRYLDRHSSQGRCRSVRSDIKLFLRQI